MKGAHSNMNCTHDVRSKKQQYTFLLNTLISTFIFIQPKQKDQSRINFDFGLFV